MSVIKTLKTEMKDLTRLGKACDRAGFHCTLSQQQAQIFLEMEGVRGNVVLTVQDNGHAQWDREYFGNRQSAADKLLTRISDLYAAQGVRDFCVQNNLEVEEEEVDGEIRFLVHS
jgi:hypothetical protein